MAGSDIEAAIREAMERNGMMAHSVPYLRGAVVVLLDELATARVTLRAIQANAEAWHGPVEEDNRHASALAVIARWAADPSTIPEGVAAAARDLDAAVRGRDGAA